ncbi:MAG: GC-type dockerin domain-anchored protein [Planctomycetota bacterium]
MRFVYLFVRFAALGVVAWVSASRAQAAPRPQGALSDKIVYVHGGHGWTADNLVDGFWRTQRGETFELVEDLNNADLMTSFANRLWNAGATVVPLRPIGQQVNEIVLDNADSGVVFEGSWFDSNAAVYFGRANETPYRFSLSSLIETAVARYTPDLPEPGLYPVYAWVTHGSNRVDQLYRVHHTGGVTEVRIDHQRVGNGLVWLGSYWFNAGTDGYVEISNQSDRTGVVIADMIRFGNGMGDIDRGGGVSGHPRADEAGLYWVMWHADRARGVSTSTYRSSSNDGSATVNLAPLWASYMNNEAFGTLADRVMVSYHTNAGGGSARGVIGLVNGNNRPSAATPNQFDLAFLLSLEVNDDMVALASSFEHDWADRSVLTLDRTDLEFGEINNELIGDEFDATIVELGFHDNRQDAEMLRDPRVQDALNRAVVQGLQQYFTLVEGVPPPTVFAPERPRNLFASPLSPSGITISWNAPASGPSQGSAPTGYRIQTSADGLGFDRGTLVQAPATSTVITSPDPARPFFRVVAENEAGQSPPSTVVAATVGPGPRVLFVNGFTRFDRTENPTQNVFFGQIERVRPRRSNSFDYTRLLAGAALDARPALQLSSADASTLGFFPGQLSPFGFDAVVWYTGEETALQATLLPSERQLLTALIGGGTHVLVSGSELGRDLEQSQSGRDFYNGRLGAALVSTDAGTRTITGEPDSPFSGLTLSLSDGTGPLSGPALDADDVESIEPIPGAVAQLRYQGGSGAVAAVSRFDPNSGATTLHTGFPLIAVEHAETRAEFFDRVFTLFGISGCVADLTTDGTNPGDPAFGRPDGAATVSDLTYLVERWLMGDAEADLTTDGTNPSDPGFGTPDGAVTVSDLTYYVELWLAGCP